MQRKTIVLEGQDANLEEVKKYTEKLLNSYYEDYSDCKRDDLQVTVNRREDGKGNCRYLVSCCYIPCFRGKDREELLEELGDLRDELADLEEELEEIEELDEDDYEDYGFESEEEYQERLDDINDDIIIVKADIEIIENLLKEKYNLQFNSENL